MSREAPGLGVLLGSGELSREKEITLPWSTNSQLRHRKKDLLSTIQAIARQTSAKGHTGEECHKAFFGRFTDLVRYELAFVEE